MFKLIFFFLFSIFLFANDNFTKEEKQWIKQNKNINVAMLNNFDPFSFVVNDKHQGLSVDILNEISKISGLEFNIKTSRWNQALNDFKSNKVDMIADISHNVSREKFTLFTKAYYEIPTYIFGLKNNNYIDNNSLKGKKVGVSKNIFYIDSLKSKGIKVVELSGSKEKAKALVTGKIDYFLSAYTSGLKAIVNQSLSNIKPIDELTSIKKEDLRFGINKDLPILYSIMEKSLSALDISYVANLSKKWIVFKESKINTAKNDLLFNEKEKQYIENTNLKNKSIKIGSIDSYMPFSFKENGKKVGFTQDLIKLISQKSGLKFEVVGGSWPEVYGKFKDNKIDMISELSLKQERLKFTNYTKPYFEIPIGVFTRDDSFVYDDITTLENKTIAIVKNSYLKDIVKKIKGAKVLEFDTTDERFYALQNKKVDVALSNAMSTYRIEKLMLQNIKLAGIFNHPDVKTEDLRFGIRKENELLTSIINKTFDSIPFSSLSQLKQKWIFQKDMKSDEEKIYLTKSEKKFIKNNPVLTYSEVNWKPLSIIQNNKMDGIMGDYLNLISKRTGLQFKFLPSNSWPDVLEQFKNKKVDVVPGIGTSPQETKLGLVSNTYSTYPMVIVTKDKYEYIGKLDSIKDLTIAVPKYYTSYNFLRKNYPNIKLIETKDIPEALIFVESGKAEAFVGHIATSLFYINNLHLENLKISGTASFKFEHKFLIQSDKPELLNIINKAIGSLTVQDKKNIHEKWISTVKTENKVDYEIIGYILAFVFLVILYFLYRQYSLKRYIKDTTELIDATMEAIVISKDGICVNVNQVAVDKMGFKSKDQMIGKNILDFICDESKEDVKANMQKNDVEPYEAKIKNKNSDSFYALVRGHILQSNGNRISSIVDITHLKQLESQAKLASMGEMIANIAHQWRQPLSVISTAATGMQLKKELNSLSDEEFYDACIHINENAQYLSQTIDDFKNFIKGDTKKVRFDLKNDTDSFIKIINSSIKRYSIQLILNLDENIKVQGYPNELIQCFINIFNNAKDAFVMNNINEDERFVFISQEVKDNHVIISFKDNAGGIPKEIIGKIFDPYFTTKHKSKGTGLGLNMSYKLIKEHMNGDIEVFNETYQFNNKTYKGAKFVLTIPLN